MAKYAVIKINGKQYMVSENQEVLVDKQKSGEIHADVLLVSADSKVKVGRPVIDGAKVSFRVLAEEEKGEKVDIFKYKSKSRYRKHTGFRPKYTRLLIEKIS